MKKLSLVAQAWDLCRSDPQLKDELLRAIAEDRPIETRGKRGVIPKVSGVDEEGLVATVLIWRKQDELRKQHGKPPIFKAEKQLFSALEAIYFVGQRQAQRIIKKYKDEGRLEGIPLAPISFEIDRL